MTIDELTSPTNQPIDDATLARIATVLRVAGDYEGHPFHGNQWTGDEHTSGAVEHGQMMTDERGRPYYRDSEEERRLFADAALPGLRDEIRRRLRDPHSQLREALTQGPRGAVVYHGTTDQALAGIAREGLAPGRPHGADEWAQAHMPDKYLDFQQGKILLGGRAHSVFLTTERGQAENFASYARTAIRERTGKDAHGVLLKVNIPRDAIDHLKLDEFSSGLRYEGVIPPDWVKVVGGGEEHPVSEYARGGALQHTTHRELAANEDGVTFYAVLFVDEEQEPTTLGGPGSGNFGHAGRPGEVGGSAPGEHAPAVDVPAGPSVSHADFNKQLASRGFTTLDAKEFLAKLPADYQKEQGVSFTNPDAPVPQAAVDGLDDAMRTLEQKAPVFYGGIKQHVTFVGGEYTPPASATTVTAPDHFYMLVNGAKDARPDKAMGPEAATFTVGARAAKDLEGEAFTRAAYKGVFLHEMGHVADALTGHGLTTVVLDSLILSGKHDIESLTAFLDKHVSGYARAGGPHEAAAEVFAATMLGHPLPRELHPVRDLILSELGRGAR